MGLLIDGKWHDQWYETAENDGRFVRKEASFRNWVTKDGSPGPSGCGGFKAERGRYHLYVSYACPWAHRTILFRALKGLEDTITISVVNPFMGEMGWSFQDDDGVIPDSLFGSEYLHQIYTRVDANYTGRVTVPALWDKETATIVSNESSEIIRMFNEAFANEGAAETDYYPRADRPEMDALNQRIYNTVNNGVYRCGFATTQAAYEEAIFPLFETFDFLDARLAERRFLIGEHTTETDWRLFTTLVRFDSVYFGHFKCNLKRLVDYINLWAYTRDLYQSPGVAETVNMNHIKRHYYSSHQSINPTRIIPAGPSIDFAAPVQRG